MRKRRERTPQANVYIHVKQNDKPIEIEKQLFFVYDMPLNTFIREIYLYTKISSFHFVFITRMLVCMCQYARITF